MKLTLVKAILIFIIMFLSFEKIFNKNFADVEGLCI